ncbi:MAG TPA: hypothetical protein VF867_12575 [Arthrobacter sp.]
MDKYARNHIIFFILFGIEALVLLLAGPENQGLRLALTGAIIVTIPFILVNSWKSAPGRRARREAAAAEAIPSAEQ